MKIKKIKKLKQFILNNKPCKVDIRKENISLDGREYAMIKSYTYPNGVIIEYIKWNSDWTRYYKLIEDARIKFDTYSITASNLEENE